MTDRELMQMALWALGIDCEDANGNKIDLVLPAIQALRERLSQPEQDSGGCRRCGGVGCDACDARCLMQLEWHSLAGTKREWFDGMVEATFAAGNDETVSVITHESVKDVALNYLPLRDRLAQPEPDAVLVEREECAAVADIALLGCERSIRDRVVRAIRARGQK